MMEIHCSWVRDRLPDHVAGRLDDIAGSRIAKHLEACPGCRAESGILERLRAPVSLPAGLEARVLRAVRAEPRPASWSLRSPATRHFAMAATVVFALVTASLLTRDSPRPADDPFGVEPREGAGVVWSAYDDPLLPGAAGLHALSVAELELVLQELER